MKKRLILSCLIILLILIFINSNYIIINIIDYTKLFINNLFFYTFIIYTISTLLIDYDLLDILNPISYITIMSLISGFPSSSKYIKELLDKEYIDIETSNYLITYTHYPNPLFIIGSVSNIIGLNYSIYLLISIYISSFITSRIFKIKSNYNYKKINNKKYNFTNNLSNAINNSFKTIIIIYGSSVFSLIIALIITNTFKLNSILYCTINGIFDLTKGIFSTTIIHNKRISTLLILLFINFSSISIHMQVRQILNNTSVSYIRFLKGRIISTFISIIILLIIFNYL